MSTTPTESMADQLEKALKALELAERVQLEQKQQLEESKRRELEAQQRFELVQRDNLDTTLLDYLKHCHQHLFTTFDVQQDPMLATTGPASAPGGKFCPTKLQHWAEFPALQTDILERLFSLSGQSRNFPSLSVTRTLGEMMTQEKIGSHTALDRFVGNFIERPVRSILTQLVKDERARDEFGILAQVRFDHRDTADSHPVTPPKVMSDRVCCYQLESALRPTNLYHIEYKPPHKIVPAAFRLGLHDMDMIKDVVNRVTIPAADIEERSRYDAEKLIAAAFTQAFDYLIWGGLSYGLLTTGEVLVFIKVDWADTTTAYHHTHILDEDAQAQLDMDKVIYWSAVSQVLAFTLAAFGQRPPNQCQQSDARSKLERWNATFDTVFSEIKDERGGNSGLRMVPEEAATHFTNSTISSAQKDQEGRRWPECYGSV